MSWAAAPAEVPVEGPGGLLEIEKAVEMGNVGNVGGVTSGGESELTTSRGSVYLSEPGPGVFLVRCTGHITAEVANAMLAYRRKATLAGRPMHIFDDTWEATGYDSEVRFILTNWGKAHSHLVKSHQLLLRSKLIAMAVAVANIPLRSRIVPMASREEFYAKLQAVIGLQQGGAAHV